MNIKQKACEAISRIPEESTFEDVQDHLCLLESTSSEISGTARR